MSNQLATVSVSDMSRMAEAVAKSGLFGMKKPEEAMALMLISQAEGLHPAIAVRDYHIIQGKPALKADAMMARFQQAGGKVEWKEISDTKVVATFSHPQGGSATIDWDMERAAAAELGGKGMWKKFPRQMLRARVISEGIRTVYPGVVIGVYTPEEVQDFDDRPAKNMGQAHTIEEGPRTEIRSATPSQSDNPKESGLKAQAKTIQSALNAATSIEAVNQVWSDFADGLDEIKDFSGTAYDHLEKLYNNRLHFFANMPAENEVA